MALNRLLSSLALVGLLAGFAWAAQDAQANFAASPGFSGRNGATCLACHTVAPVGHVDAMAVLAGLPAAWAPGEKYHLTIRVEGGPTAMPAPQPQGGLDISIDRGVLSVPAAFAGLLYTPSEQELTYRASGTLMREWQADWTAPILATRPADAHVWLAVLSANGNHVIAGNASDGGERFDSTANLTATVPASAQAIAAWKALPLLAPTAAVETGDAYTMVTGNQHDGNATAVAYRVDGGEEKAKDVGAEWRVRLDGLAPGGHAFDVRSVGSDRASPAVHVAFTVPGFALPAPHKSPAPGLVPLLLLFAVVLALRSRP